MESNYNFVVIKDSSQGGKEVYLSPQVDILEIKVEKGFAASPVGSGSSGASDWGYGTW